MCPYGRYLSQPAGLSCGKMPILDAQDNRLPVFYSREKLHE